jgi:hypothetical protein
VRKKSECLGMNDNDRMVCSMEKKKKPPRKNDPPAKVNEKNVKGDQKNMQKSTQFNSQQKIKKMFKVTKTYAYPLKKSSRRKKLPAEAKVDLDSNKMEKKLKN